MSIKKYFKSQTSLTLLVALLVMVIYPSFGQLSSTNNQKAFSNHQTPLFVISAQEVEEDEVEKSLQDGYLFYVDQRLPLPKLEISPLRNATPQVDSFFFAYLFSHISTQAP